MSRAFYVYRLWNADDRIAYVGCATNPVRRLKTHVSEAHKLILFPANHGTPFYQWLKGEIEAGRSVELEIIAGSLDERAAYAFEREEIGRAWRTGEPLKNWTIKGSGHAVFGFRGRAGRRRPGCSARSREGLTAYFKRISKEETHEALLNASAAGGSLPNGELFGASPESIRRVFRYRGFRATQDVLQFAGISER